MKQGIHPEYKATTIVCSCGNRIETKTTEDREIHVEICSVCHPFYTGKQRLVDTAGRVERFKRKYGETGSPKAAETAGRKKAAAGKAAEAGKPDKAHEPGKAGKTARAAAPAAPGSEADAPSSEPDAPSSEADASEGEG